MGQRSRGEPVLPSRAEIDLEDFCLTGAIDIALGSGATGVFTNSSWLWNKLFEVGMVYIDLSYRDDELQFLK